jgi:hypothetical protein
MQSSDDLAISQRLVALLPAQKPARLERRAQAGAGQKNYWQIIDSRATAAHTHVAKRKGIRTVGPGGHDQGLKRAHVASA